MTSDLIIVETIGHLLGYYEADLRHMHSTQTALRSNNSQDWEDFCQDKGPFAQFLGEFRIARNFQVGSRLRMFNEVREFIKTYGCNDVDSLALHLKETELTHHKKMLSLASKILFVYSPATVLPYDYLTKKAIAYKGSIYTEFRQEIEDHSSIILKAYSSISSQISDYLTCVEERFDLDDKPGIRWNRFTDKLLWTLGRRQMRLTDLNT
jgi:hypothetical protein